MKNIFTSALSLLVLAASASSIVIPGADTPLFYLVSSSSNPSANLLPVRFNTAGASAKLSGSGAIAKFYFWQGKLTLLDPAGSSTTYRPLINTLQIDVATCDTNGALVFVQGGSSNKCASPNSFYIQSNIENSQLGASLVFNWVGGFFACSGDEVANLLREKSDRSHRS